MLEPKKFKINTDKYGDSSYETTPEELKDDL
jgi:hypothetical protein